MCLSIELRAIFLSMSTSKTVPMLPSPVFGFGEKEALSGGRTDS
jgi:hypothetical protein